MPDPTPGPRLLRSLGRLTRGLSALFWGLPFALVASFHAVTGTWIGLPSAITHLTPPAAFALIAYGLWLLGDFQKQERVWIAALDRARLLALTNLGLSPFLLWHQRLPNVWFYEITVLLLATSSTIFLLLLNQALRRLAAMLPDEMLRAETAAFTRANTWMLILFPVVGSAWYLASQTSALPFHLRNLLQWIDPLRPLSLIFLALLPLSVTLSLIWKLKEAILEGVFAESVGVTPTRPASSPPPADSARPQTGPAPPAPN